MQPRLLLLPLLTSVLAVAGCGGNRGGTSLADRDSVCVTATGDTVPKSKATATTTCSPRITTARESIPK